LAAEELVNQEVLEAVLEDKQEQVKDLELNLLKAEIQEHTDSVIQEDLQMVTKVAAAEEQEVLVKLEVMVLEVLDVVAT
jgi:hypothetical protein